MTGWCGGIKTQPSHSNLGQLWRVILSSQISVGSTEAPIETASQLDFSSTRSCFFPSLGVIPRAWPKITLPTNWHLRACFLGSRTVTPNNEELCLSQTETPRHPIKGLQLHTRKSQEERRGGWCMEVISFDYGVLITFFPPSVDSLDKAAFRSLPFVISEVNI